MHPRLGNVVLPGLMKMASSLPAYRGPAQILGRLALGITEHKSLVGTDTQIEAPNALQGPVSHPPVALPTEPGPTADLYGLQLGPETRG